MDMNNLPIALHIHPQRVLPKTIVINKDRVKVENSPAPLGKLILPLVKILSNTII